ncbi:ArsR family transcriptional regulator [Lysobacter sp. K5869]|uniref:ArsR/SmtB family transcription factor n=1 Tax=Lysobacter sp. K5869 TaxID=2820808 RepID=UPI001C062E05|nr:metalloregulator ArsR/SmtB family transcription factor [Lysobacter sp. K5869]QWP75442.1 ArsR family transcriptional regulator [Lysobacter sp. K5869]
MSIRAPDSPDSANPTDPLLADCAELARGLGHPHRLALLERLQADEAPVERLAEACALSLANASQHLQQLKRIGAVQSRRDGKRVLYRLGEGPLAELLAALRRQAAHRQAQLRAVAEDAARGRGEVEGVSREQLLSRLLEGHTTLLDVRPAEEFALGHLPGAINIPLPELERRLSELAPQREIVAYCRGPYCVLSAGAVAMLRAQGLRAQRLADGFAQWRDAGLAVETGA